ncbi:hypothetical protein EV702DRAFT_1049789 [Suillus placidus]|uniref:Uncharacterized protein n=1 Tax=Suillus placidus TaxID=48579 RepID=A0A9P6ZKL8_9AGAM|nr:hypothetical protein EV702DRAFT_1049789 [Suillus placidus]
MSQTPRRLAESQPHFLQTRARITLRNSDLSFPVSILSDSDHSNRWHRWLTGLVQFNVGLTYSTVVIFNRPPYGFEVTGTHLFSVEKPLTMRLGGRYARNCSSSGTSPEAHVCEGHEPNAYKCPTGGRNMAVIDAISIEKHHSRNEPAYSTVQPDPVLDFIHESHAEGYVHGDLRLREMLNKARRRLVSYCSTSIGLVGPRGPLMPFHWSRNVRATDVEFESQSAKFY